MQIRLLAPGIISPPLSAIAAVKSGLLGVEDLAPSPTSLVRPSILSFAFATSIARDLNALRYQLRHGRCN